MAAGNAPQRVAAELDEEERKLSACLATSSAQLEAHAQALLRRSIIRSTNGDRDGALEDAEGAVALFPKRPEYLLRVAEASWACGDVAQASKAYDRAKAILDTSEAAAEDVISALGAMDRRLRPLHYIPDEIVACVFEHVYNDWEQLLNPFQLCHVSKRWREIAFSTPALWRNTRILHIQTRVPVEHRGLSVKVRKPYCFSAEEFAPKDRWGHPRDRHQIDLLEHCARKSHNTLSHLEIYTLNSHPELMDELFRVARASAATLTTFSIVNHDDTWDITPWVFRLVFKCPRLTDLSLSVGGLGDDSFNVLDRLAQTFEPMPASLRRLRVDCVDCFGESSAFSLRQIFLQRCTRLERLTLLRHTPTHFDSWPASSFGEELLAACAGTLVDLETDFPFSLFRRAQGKNVSILPRLRRFRRVTGKRVDEINEWLDMEMPKLDSSKEAFRDEELASWLRDEDELYGTKNVQELTLEVVFDSWGLQTPELEETFDALTPSIAGKVVCPRLTTFSIRRRYEQAVDATETSPFDFVSLPHGRPTYREDWEGMINASRLVQVEEERRAISAGSSAEEDKCNSTITDSALVCSSPPSKKVKLLNGADSSAASEVDSAVSPECAALDRITLEACYVDDAAWAAIKTSQSQYSVAPDPDEMKKLAYEGPDRKTKNFGERKMRRDEDQ